MKFWNILQSVSMKFWNLLAYFLNHPIHLLWHKSVSFVKYLQILFVQYDGCLLIWPALMNRFNWLWLLLTYCTWIFLLVCYVYVEVKSMFYVWEVEGCKDWYVVEKPGSARQLHGSTTERPAEQRSSVKRVCWSKETSCGGSFLFYMKPLSEVT